MILLLQKPMSQLNWKTCESVLDPTPSAPSLNITHSVLFQMTPFKHVCATWLDFIAHCVVYLLTSIRRVACWSIEEVGWGAQGCHARVSIAIHASGDRAVAALLGSGAGDIAVRRHTACTPTETYRRGRKTEKKKTHVKRSKQAEELKKKKTMKDFMQSCQILHFLKYWWMPH